MKRALLALLFLASVPAFATTRYVKASGGLASGTCTTTGTACTMTYMRTKATSPAQPGDTIILLAGDYDLGNVSNRWTISGTAGARILIIGDDAAGNCPSTGQCPTRILSKDANLTVGVRGVEICGSYLTFMHIEIIGTATDRRSTDNGTYGPSGSDEGDGFASCADPADGPWPTVQVHAGKYHDNWVIGNIVHGTFGAMGDFLVNTNSIWAYNDTYDIGYNGGRVPQGTCPCRTDGVGCTPATCSGHGHNIYAQNCKTGTYDAYPTSPPSASLCYQKLSQDQTPADKKFYANLMHDGVGLGVQIYTTNGRVDNFTMKYNTLWGPAALDRRGWGSQNNLTFGSSDGSIETFNSTVSNNYWFCNHGSYNACAGLSSSGFFWGYHGPCTSVVEMKNNYVIDTTMIGEGVGCGGGTVPPLDPTKSTGNTFALNPVPIAPSTWSRTTYNGNTYFNGTPPTTPKYFIIPHNLAEVPITEPGRCDVNLYNWHNDATITITAADLAANACLTSGHPYEIRNNQNKFADPIMCSSNSGTCVGSGNYAGGNIVFPMNAYSVFTPQPGLGVYGGGNTGTPVAPLPNGPFFNSILIIDLGNQPTPTPSNTPTNTATATNTPTNTRTFTATNTATRTNTPTQTNTPVNTFTPSNTPTLTATRTLTPTVTRTPTVTNTPSSIGTLQFSVSQCDPPVAPMTLSSDAAVIGGKYVSSSVSGGADGSSGGYVQCKVQIPADADYRMVGVIYAATGSSDSMFFQCVSCGDSAPAGSTPGPTTHVWDMAERAYCDLNGVCQSNFGEGTTGSFWQTSILDDRDVVNGCCSGIGTERVLHLTAGQAVFRFFGREIGARLAYVYLSTNLSYTPPCCGPIDTRPAPVGGSKWHRLTPKPTVKPL